MLYVSSLGLGPVLFATTVVSGIIHVYNTLIDPSLNIEVRPADNDYETDNVGGFVLHIASRSDGERQDCLESEHPSFKRKKGVHI